MEQGEGTGTPSVEGYEGFSLLGRGGFGSVWKATQTAFGREVAVKVLDVDRSDANILGRFERERLLTARLTGHPNIVTVLDAGRTTDGRPYLSTDLYAQGSAGDRLRAHGPLPAPDVARTAVKVAGALHTAHLAGIIHRDVKPENILVNAYGEVALADFGIATVRDAASTTGTTTAYTPTHAPPEVLRGEQPSAASDLYSLGSTLHHLLTGTAAFAHTGTGGLALFVDRVLNQPVAPIQRADVPPALSSLVAALMAKDPSARPPSAEVVGRAVQEIERSAGWPVTDLVIGRAAPAGTAASAPVDDPVSPAADAVMPVAPSQLVTEDDPLVPPPSGATVLPPAAPSPAPPVDGSLTVAGGRAAELAPVDASSAPPPTRRRGGLVVVLIVFVAALGAAAFFFMDRDGSDDAVATTVDSTTSPTHVSTTEPELATTTDPDTTTTTDPELATTTTGGELDPTPDTGGSQTPLPVPPSPQPTSPPSTSPRPEPTFVGVPTQLHIAEVGVGDASQAGILWNTAPGSVARYRVWRMEPGGSWQLAREVASSQTRSATGCYPQAAYSGWNFCTTEPTKAGIKTCFSVSAVAADGTESERAPELCFSGAVG